MSLLLNASLNGIIGLAAVFITCELGEKMSDAFVEINFTIDQFNWYLFPIDIKRMLPIIMANAQQPVTLEFFGSISCIRDVFKKVRIVQLAIKLIVLKLIVLVTLLLGPSLCILIFYDASTI